MNRLWVFAALVLGWATSLVLARASSQPALVAAVLPSSRSVQVGTPATAFATIINSGPGTAIGCSIAPLTSVDATFIYQTTDPVTNQVTGIANTPVDIPQGASQAFVFAFTPTAAISPTEVQLSFDCTNTDPAPVISGINTFLFSASATPIPDIVALAATVSNNGIVNIPASTGTGAFAVAAANVGSTGTLAVTADTGAGSLAVAIAICEVSPITAQCVNPPTTNPVVTSMAASATSAFGIFVSASGVLPFDPKTNRIFVRFKDDAGVTRGTTSVAVRTLEGSNVASASGAIAMTPDGATIFVVNSDSGSVSALDTHSEQKIGELLVGVSPRSLAVSPDGSRLYVTSEGTVSVVDAARLVVLATIAVGAESYGVVSDPRGQFVYVASSASATIEVIDVSLGQVIAAIPVAPRPKGLAVSADGSWLYATHFLSGEVSVIDLRQRTVLRLISTGADSNMAQKIAIHPTNGRAYLPHIRSNVANRNVLFDSTVFPLVSVVHLGANQSIAQERLDLSLGPHSVNLPFDVAFAPDGPRLYVVNLGSGDMSVINLATRQKIKDVDVGDGPRGIVLSTDGRKAYVTNSLSDDVSVVDLTTLEEIKRIPVTSSPLSPEIKRGKLLFFSSRERELSKERWMSCASCHIEGEHDGRTWFFAPSGPRNTTSLRGLAETRPLHWSADRDEVQDFEFTIRSLQAGTGLIRNVAPNPTLGAPNAGLSSDLDALTAFVESLRPKPSPFRNSDGSLTAAAMLGQQIFERPDVGCMQCHPPPRFTDSSLNSSPLVTHNIGTGDGPDEGLGPAFDAPSLRGIWDSAPYFHDGSAPTLRDVLTTKNPTDRHGRTSHLSEAELQDLIAYLLSL